jgi:spore maturation protein CgeB
MARHPGVTMRIFYAADHTPNSALPSSRLWYNNLYLPLRDLGHELVVFDFDLSEHMKNLDPSDPRQQAFIENHRPELEHALLEQLRRAHRERPIDLFFSYFYSAICRPEVIREIRSLGILTMNWYCNASYQFHLIRELAPAYDYCLVPEKFRLEDYRAAGANPLYVQEAANPNTYHPVDVPRDYDVTFVGMRYGDRAELVSRLCEAGVEIRVFGPGWLEAQGRPSLLQRLRAALGVRDGSSRLPDRVVNPPLSDEELVALYSRSKISLGFSSCGETHTDKRILQVRLRDFEAPMCGAFYMVEEMEELTEFFEPDKEIVFYKDADELVDKARFFLTHPDEREKIRLAGHRRAVAEHTWQKRFSKVFESIGLAPGSEARAC